MISTEYINRILIFLAGVLLVSIVISMLVAAGFRRNEAVCGRVMVSVRGTDAAFLDTGEVLRIAARAQGYIPDGTPVKEVNIREIEVALEKNDWVRKAEIFFDSRNNLHIVVYEREPVARIFTRNGQSFYIDSSGHKMKIKDRPVLRLPVVTGFPVASAWRRSDSILMLQVRDLVMFIRANEFWSRQAGQVDISGSGEFTMVPVVGDHLIRLGSPDDMEAKLNRLLLFYTRVMPHAGAGRYSVLDLRFSGQVVAVKREGVKAVDSMMLQRNIERMMMQRSQAMQETVTDTRNNGDNKPGTIASVPVKTDPGPDTRGVRRNDGQGLRPGAQMPPRRL